MLSQKCTLHKLVSASARLANGAWRGEKTPDAKTTGSQTQPHAWLTKPAKEPQIAVGDAFKLFQGVVHQLHRIRVAQNVVKGVSKASRRESVHGGLHDSAGGGCAPWLGTGTQSSYKHYIWEYSMGATLHISRILRVLLGRR